jgi:orotate phosphoribosyltransferase
MNESSLAVLFEQANVIKYCDIPVTYSSGTQGNLYVDCRIINSIPRLRDTVKLELSLLINNRFSRVGCICGVATGSISFATLVADQLDLPMIYWRKAKGHGLNNSIEGLYFPGDRVVVVEDVINSGESVLKTIEALIAHGVIVLGVVCIFRHDSKSKHLDGHSVMALIDKTNKVKQ